MSESYLTEADVAAIQYLPRTTPYLIAGVSHGYFSIARYYGGVKYQGERYTYDPRTDELIRHDVLAVVEKSRRKPRAKKKPQPEMFTEES